MTEDTNGQTDSSDPLGSTSFAEFGRHVALIGVAGVALGVVVGGLGGRLVMRIAALVAPDSVIGDLTENGFPIGEFTVGGTMTLLLFGGFFLGGIGAVIYLIVEPWLEWAGGWRGLLFAGFLVAANSTTVGVLDPDGLDFEILGNSPLIVGMFLLLFLLYGVLLAWVSDLLDRRLTHIDTDRPTMDSAGGWIVLAVVGAVFFIPPTFGQFVIAEVCGCEPPRLMSLFLLGLVVATTTVWVSRITGRLTAWTTGIRILGYGSLIGAAITGAIRAVRDIGTLL